MFGMGWGELMVLAVVGLFVLGPERLPAAIRWTTSTIAQVKSYAAAAKEHLDSPEFAELRKPLDELREPLAELRAADPRRALRTTLLDTLTPSQPGSSTPAGSTPAGSTPAGSTPAGSTPAGSTPAGAGSLTAEVPNQHGDTAGHHAPVQKNPVRDGPVPEGAVSASDGAPEARGGSDHRERPRER